MPARYIKFIIYLSIVVLFNVASLTLFFRIDLTENDMYSLSDASKQVVSTLSEPLTINVFFTKNLPAPYNNVERYLHDLLGEYAVHANTYFNFRFYNVSPEAEGVTPSARENQKLASDYGIRPIQIQAFEKDEVKFKKAYMGLVLIHGDMIERLPTITSVSGLEYELTMTMLKLNNKISALLNLKEKIEVTFVLSSAIKQVAPLMGIGTLNDYPDKVEQIVKSLNEKLYGRLQYRFIDPTRDKDAERDLEKRNLMRLKWPAIPDKNIPEGIATVGMIMKYGEKVREIPVLEALRIPIIGTQYNLANLNQVEEMINGNLETLIDINEDIGYLADHGTLSLSGPSPMGGQSPEGLTVFSGLVSQNYTLKPILLKDGFIPDSLRCLMIVRPTEKFTDYELYQIDQALMRGTNLAIIAEAFKEERPQAQQSFGMPQGSNFVPLDTGLEKLLEHYGIRLKRSFVMDKYCHKQMLPQQLGGGEKAIYYVPIIKNENINKNLEFMSNIKGLIAIKMSPLELDETRLSDNNIKAHRLFASSEKSWEMRDRINLNPMYLRPPPQDTDLQSYPLAYLMAGEFPSYFADKPMPEKTDTDTESDSEKKEAKKEDEEKPEDAAKAETHVDLSKFEKRGGFLAKGKPGKIFLMASSEMVKDSVLNPEGNSPNNTFILNVLDALNSRENIAVMRSKEQQFNPLMETGAFAKTVIKTFNVVGLPALVAVFGVFMWLRRLARRKRIQMIFQK